MPSPWPITSVTRTLDEGAEDDFPIENATTGHHARIVAVDASIVSSIPRGCEARVSSVSGPRVSSRKLSLAEQSSLGIVAQSRPRYRTSQPVSRQPCFRAAVPTLLHVRCCWWWAAFLEPGTICCSMHDAQHLLALCQWFLRLCQHRTASGVFFSSFPFSPAQPKLGSFLKRGKARVRSRFPSRKHMRSRVRAGSGQRPTNIGLAAFRRA
jgi:hypothetical protein